MPTTECINAVDRSQTPRNEKPEARLRRDSGLRDPGRFPVNLATNCILSALGMRTVRGDLAQALSSGQPFIAVVDAGHAVMVQGVREVNGVRQVVVRDPLQGAYMEPIADFDARLVRDPQVLSHPKYGVSDNISSEIRRTFMNPTKISKITSRHESELLSAGEVANSLLYDLLSEPELDTAFLSSMDSLPESVRQEFSCLLQRIEKDNFRWTPFLLTIPAIPADSAARSAKLRRVCALLGQESQRGRSC
ncbi:MAG: hypothetical protein WA746_05975 [Isosphaeraceae bacterium]